MAIKTEKVSKINSLLVPLINRTPHLFSSSLISYEGLILQLQIIIGSDCKSPAEEIIKRIIIKWKYSSVNLSASIHSDPIYPFQYAIGAKIFILDQRTKLKIKQKKIKNRGLAYNKLKGVFFEGFISN